MMLVRVYVLMSRLLLDRHRLAPNLLGQEFEQLIGSIWKCQLPKGPGFLEYGVRCWMDTGNANTIVFAKTYPSHATHAREPLSSKRPQDRFIAFWFDTGASRVTQRKVAEIASWSPKKKLADVRIRGQYHTS
jgi:hypothetical protein